MFRVSIAQKMQKLMNTTIEKPIADFGYTEYQSRQRFAIEVDNIDKQSNLLRNSEQFIFDGEKWDRKPYNGFAIVSMVRNNPSNMELMEVLRAVSDILDQQLNQNESYYMLPEESYHQTIANTLSEQRYFENIVDKGRFLEFPGLVRDAFRKIQLDERSVPMKMNMIGLNVFGTCIALLGEFKLEDDFNGVINFRDQFYNDPELSCLDVKWTRPFVGHITLAYLGREISANERLLLANTINEINSAFDFSNAVFHIAKTELRSYSDLSCFNSRPGYPEYHFIKL